MFCSVFDLEISWLELAYEFNRNVALSIDFLPKFHIGGLSKLHSLATSLTAVRDLSQTSVTRTMFRNESDYRRSFDIVSNLLNNCIIETLMYHTEISKCIKYISNLFDTIKFRNSIDMTIFNFYFQIYRSAGLYFGIYK